MLAVDRGIQSEGHSQVVSSYRAKTPCEEAVRRAVEKHRRVLLKRIEAFVQFVQAHDDWEFKDMVAIQFKLHLLKTIIGWAEEQQTLIDLLNETPAVTVTTA